MKNFYIKTLGCKTNQIESNLISESLEKAGFKLADSINTANIFILNSCSVTSNADNDAIRILKKAKKDNPEVFTILTGCFAQLEAERLKEFDFINLVLGNTEKMNLVSYLKKQDRINVSDIFEQKEFIYKQIDNPAKTRAYIKVQDGCNNRCSYCTIWRARGKSRSAKPQDILEQIKVYIDHGFKELVITGIHIGQWGGDLESKKSFTDLIELIESTDITRYRLGSLNPFELSEELINHLSQSEKFCPHFHMSLQSACNKTLKAMNRHYTVEHYLNQIEMINSKFSLPFIGSDIIVGFPGETDEDFETTCKNIEDSGLTMTHVFPYSIRKNTAAAEMPEQISQQIKAQRAEKLKNIVSLKYNRFLENNLQTKHTIMFEKKKCPRTGLYKGLSENYITVYANSETNICNTMQKGTLTKLEDGKMFVTLI